MDKVNFALPTLATAAMAKQDQIDLIVNQATAAIVCCYLEHMNAVIQAVPPGATNLGAHLQVITSTELVSLIDAVQGALKTV